MCKWVSVIRYLLTIYYTFMFTINMYTLLGYWGKVINK